MISVALSVVDKPILITIIETVTVHNATIINMMTNIGIYVGSQPMSFTVSHNILTLVTPPSHYLKLLDFISTLHFSVDDVVHHKPDILESDELTNSDTYLVVLLK